MALYPKLNVIGSTVHVPSLIDTHKVHRITIFMGYAALLYSYSQLCDQIVNICTS